MRYQTPMIDVLNTTTSNFTTDFPNKEIAELDYEMEIDQPEACELLIHGVNTNIVNTLRKILMSQLKTMAIEIVEVEVNSTALPDEIITHRLGLVPIVCQTLEDFAAFDTCTCNGEGCDHCSVSFTLSVQGKSLVKQYVTSDDIRFSDGRCSVIPGERIPLFYLHYGEQIFLKGKIQKGSGSVHVKWCPVSGTIFKPIDETTFRFHFESVGQLQNKEIIAQAIACLCS